jgi:hypothetical protein
MNSFFMYFLLLYVIHDIIVILENEYQRLPLILYIIIS